ncbi:MAG: LysE/ArgO family amino acid transporter [Oceanospirillaceae bacterium]|jgi:L-lysine exporter family protein LysE/ArgO|nr:LysE/ArgO family amino acid transporter [Oceanospirillaceae bacterium]
MHNSLIFINGLALSAGLIIAIGAQNAFLLNRALRCQHQYAIASFCSIADASLICLGIFGMGSLVQAQPQLLFWITCGGAVFLLLYGALSFRSAAINHTMTRDFGNSEYSLIKAIAITASVSLLNPHAYLDTVILLGSISTQYLGQEKLWFGAGAVSASFIWFFGLAWGAQWLMPIFKNPTAWRVLDGLIGLIMWSIAASLIVHIAAM